MKNQEIRFGIIGYGYWGPNHCRVVNNHPDTSLVAICEIDKKRLEDAKRMFPYAQLYEDSSELLNAEIDAVIIVTPSASHFPLVKAALEANLHVMCEKPLTISSDQLVELESILADSDSTLMCAQIFEYNSIVTYLKDYISNNDIGQYLYITASRTGLGPIRSDVNVVYDLATHDISIILLLLRMMPDYVSATGSRFFGNTVEDIAFINLEFPNKLVASIQVSWLDPIKKREIKIVGSKKMILFNDVSIDTKLKIIETGESYLSFYGDLGSFQSRISDGDIFIPNIRYDEPLQTQFNHFISCIANHTVPKTDIRNAGRIVKILEAINMSIENNGERIRI